MVLGGPSGESRASLNPLGFLEGGGEMGARMRALDWSATALGAPEGWPQSLKTVVRILLDSRYAMWMLWGPELTFFCNDAYLPTVGIKRDWVLGARSDKVWEEIWPDIGPRIDHVMRNGEATWDEDLLLFLERSGYPEETYHTFSYSPVYDDDGAVAGMLCVVTEVTERVINERRMELLGATGTALAATNTEEDLFGAIERSLGASAKDLPFTLIYLVDGADARLRRVASTGFAATDAAAPDLVELDQPWPLAHVLETSFEHVVSNLPQRFANLPRGRWDTTPTQALLLPIPQQGQARAAGVLIAGLNPYRPLDVAYRRFLELLGGQIAAGLANAHTYEEERRRAAALAEIDRAKTAFFSNVSHEFRTPLTLMMSPLEELLRSDNGDIDDGVRSSLTIAHRNSMRLLKLVNSLLDFSRLEAGRVEASYEPTDLAALTVELANVFRPAIEKASLELVIDCKTLPEPVYVDRDMWEKIVLNLLSNAFKHTLSGEIRVSLTAAGDCVELTVADTGVGIPDDSLPHVFERFYRVPNARARTHEGSGIGLALVQELVALHGGTIGVVSRVNEGTRFSVRLLRGQAHLPAERIGAARRLASTAIAAETFADEASRWVPDQEVSDGDVPLRLPPSAGISTQAVPKDSATVLLVDDNADMRQYVHRLLAQRFHVIVARDGVDALRVVEGARPDIVLTDVMMPRLDGFGLLKALRGDARTRDIPVILLSARAGEESRIEGADAGADDYLVKPFAARELLARVASNLAVARVRREAAKLARESEERFRIMADSAPLFIWVLDRDAKVQFANRAYYEFFGITHEELEATGWSSLVHPDDLDRWDGEVEAALAEQRGFSSRARVRRADGAWRWLQSYASPRFSPDGDFLGLVGSSPDITEMVEAADALRDADRRKDEFLATLAHEMRNPLAPIRQAAQISRSPYATDAQIKWSREVIERQVQHMSRLLDDLLDVSRITRGKLALRRENVELAAVVDTAVETARPLIEARRHRLTLDLPDKPIRLVADGLRVAQVLSNLLGNAAKYSEPAGHIRVTARADFGMLTITVADSGIGIESDVLPRIFEMFAQATSALERSEGGLGIGLALVRGLVELHGGTVEARSGGPGRGAEFIVRLPLLDEIGTTVPEHREAERMGDSVLRARVLVADDNRDAAESLAMHLELDGHEMKIAYDGEQAFATAALFRPDVVFLDIGMPRLNGYEVAQRIRAEPWGKAMKLIAVTGWGQSEDKRRAFESGFDHHITKPINPQSLRPLFGGDLQGH
jgi:PAS domain S-box-containing protein